MPSKELQQSIIDYIIEADGLRVSSSEIREAFVIGDGTANPVTRGLIKKAMRDQSLTAGIPIGADNKGYFLIKSESDLEVYVNQLRGRIRGIAERIVLVKRSWAEKKSVQGGQSG